MPSLRHQVAWFPADDRSLPPLPPPSPTLTNPDMVLPSTGASFMTSPPRDYDRPPSPSYLRQQRGSPTTESVVSDVDSTLMTARQVTVPSAQAAMRVQQQHHQLQPHVRSQQPSGRLYLRSSPLRESFGSDAQLPSSSVLYHLPSSLHKMRDQPTEPLRPPRSSDENNRSVTPRHHPQNTYDMDDQRSEVESVAPYAFDPYSDPDHGVEAQRRKEEEEYNSAVLSKRAEEILANAKKRLNVMEGNLRGARDLVAPLTAANLKRAATLGAAAYAPTYGVDQYVESEAMAQQQLVTPRKLQTKASSPTMGRDFSPHHRARQYSDIDLPERPYTSLEKTNVMSPNMDPPRSKTSLAPSLRGSRSVDSLGAAHAGGHGVNIVSGRDRGSHSKNSSGSSFLEPLHEHDDDSGHHYAETVSSTSSSQRERGGTRPTSRTSTLRDQMSSLKGRISSLQQRAREDSLHRQSMQSLRNSSPFNNAATAPPEIYRADTPDANAPAEAVSTGSASKAARPAPSLAASSTSSRRLREGIDSAIGGSRNAFAEQAAAQKRQLEQARSIDVDIPQTPESKQRRPQQPSPLKTAHIATQTSHRKSSSGTGSGSVKSSQGWSSGESQVYQTKSSSQRISHAPHGSPRATASEADGYQADASSYASDTTLSVADESDFQSQADPTSPDDKASVYEDARQSRIVAHEDREDAFDYEHLFIHSAMGIYKEHVLVHEPAASDSEGSVSSSKTARGPGPALDDPDSETSLYPPPTPETPERLRQIERNLHMRKFSTESMSTVNSFATANEEHRGYDDDDDLPDPIPASNSDYYFHDPFPSSSKNPSSRPSSRAARPRSAISSSTPAPASEPRNFSRSTSRPRPATAVKLPPATNPSPPPPLPTTAPHRRSSSSERADSGVSLHRHALSSTTTASSTSSDPRHLHFQPKAALSLANPVAAAVAALLLPPSGDPDAPPIPLGLRDKAALYALVDLLRNGLVRSRERGADGAGLTRGLERAREVLEEAGLGIREVEE